MGKTINILMIGLLLAGAGWTFMIKQKSEVAEEKVVELERAIQNEKDEIDLLKADWALLNSPARLQTLVDQYDAQLKLEITRPEQVIDLKHMPEFRIEPEKPLGSQQAGTTDQDGVVTGSVKTPRQPYPTDGTPIGGYQ